MQENRQRLNACLIYSKKSMAIFGKGAVEHEIAIKNDIRVVFDDLHVPETLNATQLDKFMK